MNGGLDALGRGGVVCWICFLILYPWVLDYRISLQAHDALDALDAHLKIEGEFRP